MFNNARRQLRQALFPGKHLDLSAARAKLALPGRVVEEEIPYAPPTPAGEAPATTSPRRWSRSGPRTSSAAPSGRPTGQRYGLGPSLRRSTKRTATTPFRWTTGWNPGSTPSTPSWGAARRRWPPARRSYATTAGWPVFHTGAFKVGNHIKRGELYHFSDTLPAGADRGMYRVSCRGMGVTSRFGLGSGLGAANAAASRCRGGSR